MDKEFENLFAGLISGRAKAEFLLIHGTEEQKRLAGDYIDKEQQLMKFYEKNYAFINANPKNPQHDPKP